MIRLKPITKEQLDKVCDFNKKIMAAFLTDSTELSPTTRMSYESSLKVWFVYVSERCENRRHIDIKPLDYKRFTSWCMVERGASSSVLSYKY